MIKWNDVKELSGENPNVWKYVFEKEAAVAESVLYKYPTFEERTVMCISTQSGCPVGCRFCGAGDYFVKSLDNVEIIEQVAHMLETKNLDPATIDKWQIMFMSMGEPLLNYRNLQSALYELNFLYPQAALLISSIGPDVDYSQLIQDSIEIDKVGLQFSVHESTDEKRNKLIPFKKKLSLKEISEKGLEWALATGRRPFFNYCAHEENTTDDDVSRLSELFPPEVWEATISVVCEREEDVAAANARQRDLASDFMSKMLGVGFSTRMFDPAGQDDIGGGCGQLWFVQDWMKNNPTKAKPSAGFSLPVIHTPRKED